MCFQDGLLKGNRVRPVFRANCGVVASSPSLLLLFPSPRRFLRPPFLFHLWPPAQQRCAASGSRLKPPAVSGLPSRRTWHSASPGNARCSAPPGLTTLSWPCARGYDAAGWRSVAAGAAQQHRRGDRTVGTGHPCTKLQAARGPLRTAVAPRTSRTTRATAAPLPPYAGPRNWAMRRPTAMLQLRARTGCLATGLAFRGLAVRCRVRTAVVQRPGD